MANTLLAATGNDMKSSKLENDWLARGRTLVEQAKARGVDLLLPTDVVVAAASDATSGTVVRASSVPAGEMALDIGPDSVQAIAARVAKAKTIFWNGPMGLFENPAFASGTNGVAQALAQGSGFSVVGGGDSVAAVEAAGDAVRSKMGFISTGGGASLELIEGKKLPGVEALRS
jgi:phosphoglycerate kinase